MQQKSCNQVITARQDRLLPMPSSTARWMNSVTDEDEVNGRSSEGRPCLHEVCRVVTDEDEVNGLAVDKEIIFET